jgi:DNA polymerase III delta subunit
MPDNKNIEDLILDDKLFSLIFIENDSYYESKILSFLKNLLNSDLYSTDVFIRDLAEKYNINGIIDELNTLPFGDRKRYFILKNVDKIKKDELTLINDYNLKPNKKVKVFYFSTKSNFKLKVDIEIKFKSNRDNIRDLILEKLKLSNINLDKNIVDKLLSKISENRLKVDKEINNIINLMNNSDDIKTTMDYIDNNKREFFNESYSLDIDINKKNRKNLLKNYEKTNFNENIFMEVGRITWKYKLYLKIKILLKDGYKDSEIIEKIKVSKYQFKYIKNEANNLSLNDILKTLIELVKADKKLKSTDIPSEIISFNLLKNISK